MRFHGHIPDATGIVWGIEQEMGSDDGDQDFYPEEEMEGWMEIALNRSQLLRRGAHLPPDEQDAKDSTKDENTDESSAVLESDKTVDTAASQASAIDLDLPREGIDGGIKHKSDDADFLSCLSGPEQEEELQAINELYDKSVC